MRSGAVPLTAAVFQADATGERLQRSWRHDGHRELGKIGGAGVDTHQTGERGERNGAAGREPESNEASQKARTIHGETFFTDIR